MSSEQFIIEFNPSGRGKARCPANPMFPNGITVDMAQAKKGCVVELPYPAPECGIWLVKCADCKLLVGATAAGRNDDPKTLIIPCKDKH